MGIVTTKFLLRNPRLPQLAVEVQAVADTGSVHLCIPEHVRAKLQLDVQKSRGRYGRPCFGR